MASNAPNLEWVKPPARDSDKKLAPPGLPAPDPPREGDLYALRNVRTLEVLHYHHFGTGLTWPILSRSYTEAWDRRDGLYGHAANDCAEIVRLTGEAARPARAAQAACRAYREVMDAMDALEAEDALETTDGEDETPAPPDRTLRLWGTLMLLGLGFLGGLLFSLGLERLWGGG